ncbi:MAG: hypothetical protein DI529_15370 [Chryseobacterium sp.]|nr:MAG: hypothetical protein DI529_15370 [Chryseobacterium sp.]
MEKEKTLEFLNKYNYKFYEENHKIVVKLDFSQRVYLDFSENAKLKVTDRLTGWNFLTGLLNMSLKNAVIYNAIMSFFAGVIILIVNSKEINSSLLIVFGFCTIQYLFFAIYYLIKLESFKIQLMQNQ